MDRRSKVLWGTTGVLVVVVIAFAVGIAHNVSERDGKSDKAARVEPAPVLATPIVPERFVVSKVLHASAEQADIIAAQVQKFCEQRARRASAPIAELWKAPDFTVEHNQVLDNGMTSWTWTVSASLKGPEVSTLTRNNVLWYRLDDARLQIFPMKPISGELCGNIPAERWSAFDVPARPFPAEPVVALTVRLPPRRIDVHKLLGSTLAEMTRVLGKSERMDDGPYMFAIDEGKEDDVGVLVSFEFTKATYIAITARDFHGTSGDREALSTWAGILASDDVDLDDSGLNVWAPKARERMEHRRAITKRLTDIMKAGGAAPSAYASVSGHTTLSIFPGPGDQSCDRATLAKLRDSFKGSEDDLAVAGFERMQCGLDGASLKL